MPIDGFIFDLDGTLYLGEAALPGAVETIRVLRERGKRLLFVTNKPLFTRKDYAAKLTRLGMPAEAEEVISSSYVLGYHLEKTAPHLAYYVVGEETLKAELRAHGLRILDEFYDQDEKTALDPEGVEAVVVAFDRSLDYRKLNTAFQALRRGARFFATNPDKNCPMPGGAIPDAGATLAALERITGRKPEVVAGKPSRLMLEVAMQRLHLPPQRCVMVGDRLETDMHMGIEAGMRTALVLTGMSTLEQAKKFQPAPDWILNNVGELVEKIKDGP